MSNLFRAGSALSQAFDAVMTMGVALDRAWTCHRERAGLRHVMADARHHVCEVIADLDEVARHAQPLRPHTVVDLLGEGTRVLAHEAYLSVLSLGQLLRRATEDGLAPVPDLELAQAATARLLDELTPYISRADDALRRVLLDHEPFEVALERLGRAG
jgi:hypothetical protein